MLIANDVEWDAKQCSRGYHLSHFHHLFITSWIFYFGSSFILIRGVHRANQDEVCFGLNLACFPLEFKNEFICTRAGSNLRFKTGSVKLLLLILPSVNIHKRNFQKEMSHREEKAYVIALYLYYYNIPLFINIYMKRIGCTFKILFFI